MSTALWFVVETPDRGVARAAFRAAVALSVAGTELAPAVPDAWTPRIEVPAAVANVLLPARERLAAGGTVVAEVQDVPLYDGDPAAPFVAAWGVNVLVSVPEDPGGAAAALAAALVAGWTAQPRRPRTPSPWTLAAYPDAAIPYVRELPGGDVAVRMLLAPPLHPRRAWA